MNAVFVEMLPAKLQQSLKISHINDRLYMYYNPHYANIRKDYGCYNVL